MQKLVAVVVTVTNINHKITAKRLRRAESLR